MKRRPSEVSPLDHMPSNGIRITVGCGLGCLKKRELQLYRGVTKVQRCAHCGIKGKMSKLISQLEQEIFSKKIIEDIINKLGKEQLVEDTEWQSDKPEICSVVP